MKRLSSLLRTMRRLTSAAELAAEPGLSIGQLFDATLEATMIIDAASGAVIEVNPAAAELLGRAREGLVGASWLSAFSTQSVLALTKLESVAQTTGIAAPIRASSRVLSREIDVGLSLVRATPAEFLLAHLSAADASLDLAGTTDPTGSSVEVLSMAAEGFVVTDPGLRVLYANQAFARLVGVRGSPDALGKSLTRWFEFTQDDLTVLARQMQTREAVSAVRATLTPSSSKSRSRGVELTAVAVPDEPQKCFGFWIRDSSDSGPAQGFGPVPQPPTQG